MRERGSERAVCGARLAAPGGARLAVQLAVRWATPAACGKAARGLLRAAAPGLGCSLLCAGRRLLLAVSIAAPRGAAAHHRVSSKRSSSAAPQRQSQPGPAAPALYKIINIIK